MLTPAIIVVFAFFAVLAVVGAITWALEVRRWDRLEAAARAPARQSLREFRADRRAYR
jgi:hypothetical protein